MKKQLLLFYLINQFNFKQVLLYLLSTAFHRYITESIFNNTEISPFGKPLYVKPEIKHNNSKLDFYLETEKDKIYVEVKEGSAFLTLSP